MPGFYLVSILSSNRSKRNLSKHSQAAPQNCPLALYDPITIRVFHVKTFYRAARGAQVSKEGLPFGPFEKVFVFLFAEEAGTYVPTPSRSRNSETADELGTAAVFTCVVGH